MRSSRWRTESPRRSANSIVVVMADAEDPEPSQRSDDPAPRPEDPARRSDEEERQARATALLDEAQRAALEHGRAVVAEARAVRRRMLEDADDRRRQIVTELERLRDAIDATLAALRTPATDVPAAPRAAGDPRGASADDTFPGTPDDGRVSAVFDQLRATPPKPKPKAAPKPRPKPKPKVAPEPAPDASSEHAASGGEPGSPEAGGATAPSSDADGSPPDGAEARPGGEAAGRRDRPAHVDPALARRDSVLEPLLPDVLRSAKRLLQDEQNSLLDAVRRARGKHEATRLLPEAVRQRETWTALLAPSFNAAYLGGRAASGKSGRVSRAPDRVVIELAAALVNPLRERITVTIDAVVAEGPYESAVELQRALGTAIGARFREWRTVDLEQRILDVLTAAYARGAYEAAGPAAMLRWLPDEPGRCPDCDDNALEPTLKGKPFPTGQTHPPAHPGCRCIALPGEAS